MNTKAVKVAEQQHPRGPVRTRGRRRPPGSPSPSTRCEGRRPAGAPPPASPTRAPARGAGPSTATPRGRRSSRRTSPTPSACPVRASSTASCPAAASPPSRRRTWRPCAGRCGRWRCGRSSTATPRRAVERRWRSRTGRSCTGPGAGKPVAGLRWLHRPSRAAAYRTTSTTGAYAGLERTRRLRTVPWFAGVGSTVAVRCAPLCAPRDGDAEEHLRGDQGGELLLAVLLGAGGPPGRTR